MRRTSILMVVGLTGVALLASAVSPAPAAPAPADYRISDLKAQLFFSDRGTFSDDLLKRRDLGLWNTIIGGGGAGGPSSATLLVVEVSGKPDSYPAGRSVELAVRTERKEIFRRRLSVSVLGADGHGYVAFWLYDTGCEPLTVSTALLGQADPTRRVATIPFECGE